jgi:hypothetical protein
MCEQVYTVSLREFVINEKLNHNAIVVVIFHDLESLPMFKDPPHVGPNRVRSLARALPRRDMTVPAGHRKTLAICW